MKRGCGNNQMVKGGDLIHNDYSVMDWDERGVESCLGVRENRMRMWKVRGELKRVMMGSRGNTFYKGGELLSVWTCMWEFVVWGECDKNGRCWNGCDRGE